MPGCDVAKGEYAHLDAGPHETLVVKRDEAGQPIRVGCGADHDEQRTCLDIARRAGRGFPDCHGFKVLVTMECHHRAAVSYIDRRVGVEPAGKIARHGSGQRKASHDQVHAGSGSAEIHRRLTGGVAAADDHRLRAPAIARFHLGRSVVDAVALKLGEPVDRQPPVLNAGRNNDSAPPNASTAVERRAKTPVREALQSRHPAWHCEARAELHRLHLTTPD